MMSSPRKLWYSHTIRVVQTKTPKPLYLLGFLDFYFKFALFYIANIGSGNLYALRGQGLSAP